MIKGLYTAATAMVAKKQEMDVISNNLANINTTGYKKDDVITESFNDRLITAMDGSQTTTGSLADEVTFSKEGDYYYASTDEGYFKVETDNGIHNGRDIKFKVNDSGYLTTYSKSEENTVDDSYNQKVLGANGPIYVGDSEFEIDSNGNVNIGGSTVDSMVFQDGKNVIGTLNGGVKIERLYTDFEQGVLNATNNSSDIALDGDGMFVFLDDNGEDIYSRNGVLSLNQYGELVNLEGYNLKGFDGEAIVLEGGDFIVNDFGEIYSDGEMVNKIQTVSFDNTSDIYKIGESLYKTVENMQGNINEFTGVVRQGYAEASNVSSITEMIKMIETNRTYESCQKVITTIDEMIEKAVTEVGVVG